MAEDLGQPARKRQKREQKPSQGFKLAPLPHDAKVNKRPLLRPPIASSRADSSVEKVVYVGTKTPFLSAVKRVEKLLHFSDKRLVQSATRRVQNDAKRRRRQQRGGGVGDDEDELALVTDLAEKQKRAEGEEIVVKGTGKAVAKVLEIALWFQQREGQFAVRLKTSSADSIDDVEYQEENAAEGDFTEETRIRKVSVLQVFVRLR